MKRLRLGIAVRILALDVLLVFLPVASFTLLDTYEKGLLASLEASLAQQARLLAAWLGQGELDQAAARAALDAVGDRRTARYRVVGLDGRLLADSSEAPALAERFDPPSRAYAAEPEPPSGAESGPEPGLDSVAESGPIATRLQPAANETLIYRLLSLPTRLYRRYLAPPVPALGSADFYATASRLDGVELRQALSGSYGSATRVSSGGQVSVTLYSAVPILRAGKPAGAVLVSQSTWRILGELYALRLDSGRIFLWSLAAAILISSYLSFSIIQPLGKLRRAASRALDARGGPAAAFPEARGGDEVSELARAFRALLERLEDRMRRTERFAADVSHEFRNPLAAIRSAAELALAPRSEADRARFLGAIVEDADRLAALTEALRDLSAAESPGRARVALDLSAFAQAACERARERLERERAPGSGSAPAIPEFHVEGPTGPGPSMEPARLEAILGNLVDNAASFASRTVRVRVEREGDPNPQAFLLAVEDDGPGIPEEHLERVFDRFFSWRPNQNGKRHSGLGLALARALVEAEGGSLRATNHPSGGARFVARFPVEGGRSREEAALPPQKSRIPVS